MKSDYSAFRKVFLNNTTYLQVILQQLNNDCYKIRIEALIVLHEFFVDIDTLEESVIVLILDNKDNFYLMFDINVDIFKTIDIEEKKNFILFQLERINSII